MLSFDSAATLLDAFKRVNFPAANITPNTANAHILLEQREDSKLEVTAYGKDGAWLKQIIDSPSSQEGLKHLILATDLPKIHRSIKSKYGLVIRDIAGALQFSSIKGFIDGEPDVLDTIQVQQFHGAIEEFGPPVFHESYDGDEPLNPTVLFDESQLAQTLNLIDTFAEFGKSKELRGFYIGISSDGVAEFYVNSFEPNYYLKLTIACDVLIPTTEGDTFEFILRGEHIDMIAAALKPDEKKKTTENSSTARLVLHRQEGLTDHITIYGSLGSVTMPGLPLKRYLMLTHAPANFEESPYLEPQGYRTFDIGRMKEALEAQEPTKDAQGKRIKIHADNEYLVVSKLADYALKEFSRVVTEDTEALTTEFQTLAYTAAGLLQIMSVLDKIRTRHSVKGLALLRTVRNTKVTKRWAVYAALVEETGWGSHEIMAVVTEPREGDI